MLDGSLIGLSPLALDFALVAMFAGALIRGYSGFGSSMFWVTSVSLVVPPAEIVPTIYILEVLASAHLLPRAWAEVDWRSVRWMLLGALVATPAGVYLLATVPAAPIVVLGAVLVLWRGLGPQRRLGPVATIATGAVSGLVNGATSAGGPPAVLYYLTSPVGASAMRASLIAYLLGTDVLATGFAAAEGLITWNTLYRSAAFFVVVWIGLALGQRWFVKTKPESFRRFVLALLGALALAGILRVVF
jgi:uncharacterized membrane protein YfcA